jgi:spore coat protein SA
MSAYFLYPTRAVSIHSSFSVARVSAQLAQGLNSNGHHSITVLQEADDPDKTDESRAFKVVSLANGLIPRGLSKILKKCGIRSLGGRLRLDGWYKEAVRHIRSSPDFIITNQSVSVNRIRQRFPGVPVFLWTHDVPQTKEGLAGVRAATAVIVASAYVQNRLWELLKDGSFPSAIWIIPLPIDNQCFYPCDDIERSTIRKSFSIHPSNKILGFASSLSPHKGLHIALTALHGLKREKRTSIDDLRLLVAGEQQDGIGQAYFEMAHKYNIQLQFTGRLSPQRLREYYCSLDLLLVPSTWAEPFGLVALEALACGTPVLASRAGGLIEVCEGQPNARLVNPPNSPLAWAEAIDDVFKNGRSVKKGNPRYTTLREFITLWEQVLTYHMPGIRN